MFVSSDCFYDVTYFFRLTFRCGWRWSSWPLPAVQQPQTTTSEGERAANSNSIVKAAAAEEGAAREGLEEKEALNKPQLVA